MELISFKKGVNLETFQPTVDITLRLSMELLQDAAALYPPKDLHDLLGKEFLRCLEEGVRGSKDA